MRQSRIFGGLADRGREYVRELQWNRSRRWCVRWGDGVFNAHVDNVRCSAFYQRPGGQST